jgi:hypothetical protein
MHQKEGLNGTARALLGILAFATLFFISLLVIYFGYHIATEYIETQPLYYITLSGFIAIWFVTIFYALILADKIITG